MAVPVITSLTRRSALFNTVISNLGVTGVNLAGATFSFGTVGLTVTEASGNATGTSANLAVQVGTLAGTFPLVATNGSGSSTPGITATNSFTVVNPSSTADTDDDGFPDFVEAIFGSDPLDANSKPDTNLSLAGEIDAFAFAVLNRAGDTSGQTTLEADAVAFSALNLAGVTGGQPIRLEVDALAFSILNTAGSVPGQPGIRESNATAFSALNLAGVTGGQPLRMDVNGLPFSVFNVNPAAPLGAQVGSGNGNGGGQGGSQPPVMEADAVPFSVNNTAPSAPAAAQQARLSPAGTSPAPGRPGAAGSVTVLASRPLPGIPIIVLNIARPSSYLAVGHIPPPRRKP